MKKFALLAITLMASQLSFAQQQPANSLEELLKQVEQARVAESAEHRKRQQAFLADKSKQQQKVNQTQQEKNRQETLSASLEEQFQNNEALIEQRQEQLQKRLGSLTELFGHLTASAGDLRSELQGSVISAQYPGREEKLTGFIEKMSNSSVLPTVEEIEQLWFESQREMTEAGRVVKFNTQVTDIDGSRNNHEVVRVGAFNLTAAGNYLHFDEETGNISVLARQPKAGLFDNRFANQAANLQAATSGTHAFALDPTGPSGGSYLSALINSPSLIERWKQGGIVGIVISLLFVYAFVVAIWRLLALSSISRKVRAQLNNPQASDNNPLGRVIAVFESNRHLDMESLEYKMAEAILHERPSIERGASSLKIIAMVAPLLGLLGTVVGMIMTFQAITIFGAGDPQTMAGGISSALVTTVLGLCVAVPTVMLHAIVAYRSRQLLSVLEKQSFGLVAERVESQAAA